MNCHSTRRRLGSLGYNARNGRIDRSVSTSETKMIIKSLNKKKTEELKILIINEFVSEEIINSSRISIGSNISTSDVSVIERLASLIINLSEFFQ